MKFEINDVRCALTMLNVVLVLCFGTSFAFIGLAVTLFGIFKDWKTDRHINGFLMHGANFVMYLCLILRNI